MFSEEAAKSYSLMPSPESLPDVGSLESFLSLGGPAGRDAVALAYYQRYGKMVRINLMGQESVSVYDPEEYLKVFQAEGKYPIGASAKFWPFTKYFALRDIEAPFNHADEVWATRRRHMAKHMVSPMAAHSYVPMVDQAAREAVKFVHKFEHDIPDFCNRAACDMICSLMLGRCLSTVDKENCAPEDDQFITDAMTAMGLAGTMVADPRTTDQWDTFVETMDRVYARTMKLVEDMMDAAVADPDSLPSMSLLARLTRDKQLSRKQLVEQAAGLLFAGVDTTANVLNWTLLNMAKNPDKQEKLHQELTSVLKESGGMDGPLDVDMLRRMPYLKACFRESHRITPPSYLLTQRDLREPITIGGYSIPAGVSLDFISYPMQNDCDIVGPDAEDFKPERFLPEAVQARKGTPAEVIDHVLMSSPFSFGPKMCLGGRIAQMELNCVVTRLISECRFELDPPEQDYKRMSLLFAKATPYPTMKIQRFRNH